MNPSRNQNQNAIEDSKQRATVHRDADGGAAAAQPDAAALFYADPYLREFEARVVSIATADGHWDVCLDQSAFYPAGGGQPGDRGTIDALRVVDTYCSATAGIVHRLSARPEFAVGDRVRCELDWEHRYEFMQQHTGQHLLSAALMRVAQLPTVAVHLGDDTTTIEVDAAAVADATIAEAEALVAQAISWNLRVSQIWADAENIAQYNPRRQVTRTGRVRLIQVEGFDSVGCGGVHTATTGEVMLVKVVGVERIRGHQRVHAKIGGRALADYALKHQVCAHLSRQFSAPVAELAAAAARPVAEAAAAATTTGRLLDRLAVLQARALSSAAAPRRRVLFGWFNDELDPEPRRIGQALTSQFAADATGAAEATAADDATGADVYVLAATAPTSTSESTRTTWCVVSRAAWFDFARFRTQVLQPLQAKGGGSAPLWQGMAPVAGEVWEKAVNDWVNAQS